MKKKYIAIAAGLCAALIPASVALAAQVRAYSRAPGKQTTMQQTTRRSMRDATYQTRNAQAAIRRRHASKNASFVNGSQATSSSSSSSSSSSASSESSK